MITISLEDARQRLDTNSPIYLKLNDSGKEKVKEYYETQSPFYVIIEDDEWNRIFKNIEKNDLVLIVKFGVQLYTVMKGNKAGLTKYDFDCYVNI